jgi:Fe-only nitrogenase accessory protein AnfO
MLRQIAVLCRNNCPSSLKEAEKIHIFESPEQNASGDWLERKIFPFQLKKTTRMSEFRDEIRTLITKLGDCRIIAGSSIDGLAYHILDRMGFHIFEISSLDSATLHGIAQDVAQADALPEKEDNLPLAPSASSPGIYYLDFIRLQQVHPEISSKRALQPFLQSTPFIQLNVLCSHVPLWLAAPAYKKIYTLRTKKYGSNLLLSLSPKNCFKED